MMLENEPFLLRAAPAKKVLAATRLCRLCGRTAQVAYCSAPGALPAFFLASSAFKSVVQASGSGA